MNSTRWLFASFMVPLVVLAGCGQDRQAAPKTPPATVAQKPSAPPTPTMPPEQKHNLESSTRPNHHYAHDHAKLKKQQSKLTSWANFYVPILEFHDTVAIPGDPYTMSPTQLDDEMSFLKSHGFHTVTLDDVYNAIHRNRPLPSRPIVLTFDDGYESNYTTATPILQKCGFVATEFMVSGFMNKRGFLTSSQLQAMENSHVWEIESHTQSHPELPKLNATDLWQQVSQPKTVLSEVVGAPVNYFCYPFGAYNGKVVKDVMRAGYLLAVCTAQGYANPATDGPFLLNRIAIHQGLTIDEFAKLLSRSLS